MLNKTKSAGITKRKCAPRSRSPLGSLPKVKVVDINQQTVQDLLREVSELRGEQQNQIDALDAVDVQHSLELDAMQERLVILVQVSCMRTAR